MILRLILCFDFSFFLNSFTSRSTCLTLSILSFKESTNVEYADEIDTRALRSLNQMLQIQSDFWEETHDDGDGRKNPFNQPLKGSMGRSRKQTKKMQESKSLQEAFLERRKKAAARAKKKKKKKKT